jgi:hypothetical protein
MKVGILKIGQNPFTALEARRAYDFGPKYLTAAVDFKSQKRGPTQIVNKIKLHNSSFFEYRPALIPKADLASLPGHQQPDELRSWMLQR